MITFQKNVLFQRDGQSSDFHIPVQASSDVSNSYRSTLSGVKICVIEDDQATAKFYFRLLEKLHAEVVICSSVDDFRQKLEGGEGWIKTPADAPKVVISDLVLPDGDGIEILGLWRKHFPQRPVIMVTAFASVENAVDAMRKGAFDFLRKPLQHDELQIVINRAVEHLSILAENESLSGAVRILSIAQTLSGIADKDTLLKTLGRVLQREFAMDECFVFQYHANRSYLESTVDFRNPGVPRRAPEVVASECLTPLIAERSPPPENISETAPNDMVDHPFTHDIPQGEGFIVELVSRTGNSAFLVYFGNNKENVDKKSQEFFPIMVQAQRTYQNLDVAAALSFVDELTGLYNQRFLDVALSNEIARAHRYGGSVAVIFIDLDRFKSVNDTFGHIVGSAILKASSRLFKTCMRDADQVLRYGGDEFVAILPNTNLDGALVVAERIRAAFDRHRFDVSSETQIPEASSIHITTSIGVSTYPDLSNEARELVQMADNAMYDSKRSGKNRVSEADPKKPEHKSSHRQGSLGHSNKKAN